MNPFNLQITNPIKPASSTKKPSQTATNITNAIGGLFNKVKSAITTPKAQATTTSNAINQMSSLGQGYIPITTSGIGSFGQYTNQTSQQTQIAKQLEQIPNQYTPAPKAPIQSQIDSTKITNQSYNPELISTSQNQYTPPDQSNLSNTGMVLDGVASQEPKTQLQDTNKTKEQEYIDRLLSRDIGAEKSNLREQADIQTKLVEYNTALAEYKNKKARYEDNIEKMKTNSEGKFGGALEREIEQYTQKANKDLANMAIQTELLQNNYFGAEKILNAQIDDLQSSFDNEIKTFGVAMDFIKNDMTESEKQAATEAFELKKIDYENQIKESETQGKNLILQAKADNYQKLLDNGNVAIKDIPADVMAFMNTSGYVSPEQKTAKTQTQNLLSSFDQFRQLGATGAVGPKASKVLPAFASIFGIGNYESDKSLVANIKSQLTLNNLSFLKGAMSDKDILFITQASSALNENGTEAQFKKELLNIQSKIVNGVLNSPAYSPSEKEAMLTNQLILEYPNATDKEILDLVNQKLPEQAFNSAGNASASNIASAIKTVESGGNYNAKGASGEFGAYQFMPSTWKQWAGEFLGNSNAQPTKQNQDFVAQSKINQLINAGYNAEEIALIWNGGTPQRKKGVNQYGVSYDSGAYANKVINQLKA